LGLRSESISTEALLEYLHVLDLVSDVRLNPEIEDQHRWIVIFLANRPMDVSSLVWWSLSLGRKFGNPELLQDANFSFG